MANPMTLRVITPDTVALDTTADEVVLPGLDGKLGLLTGHATMVTALDIGELRYKIGGSEASMFVAGGFAEVRDFDVDEHGDLDGGQRPQAGKVIASSTRAFCSRLCMRFEPVAGAA